MPKHSPVLRYLRSLRAFLRPEPVTGARFVRGAVRATLRTSQAALSDLGRDLYGLRRDHDRLVAAVTGETLAEPITAPPFRASFARERELWALARRLRETGGLDEDAVPGAQVILTALRRGEALEDATARFARLTPVGRHVPALGVVQGMQVHEATRTAGRLGEAVLATRLERIELAWARFDQLPDDLVARTAPVERLRAGLLMDEAARATAVTATAAALAQVEDAGDVLALAELAVGAGEGALATAAGARVEALLAASGEVDPELARSWRWLRPWVRRAVAPEPATRPSEGALTFALIDYEQPDYEATTSNLGDYVQTLAASGNLLRHRNLRFEGDPGLVDVMERLHGRVRPERMLDTAERTVNVVRFDRDASHATDLPAPAWTIVFGWYMHAQFGLRFDFPFAEQVRPIFISFHVNRREMLTEQAVAYLRQYGPVGCRDWNTVFLLLSAGVPAFFSGCLTTTTGTLFGDLPDGFRPTPGTAYVDTAGPVGSTMIKQLDEQSRWDDLPHNLDRAVDLLESYRRDYDHVVTSRLHCFLPSWSIGVDVDFQPRKKADLRFNGLLDATEADRAAMRERIAGLLAAVTTALVEGRCEEEVYRVWREVTAEHVALAEARFTDLAEIAPPAVDVPAAVATVRAAEVVHERTAAMPAGPEVDVAFALDGNLRRELDVVVTSMLAHTSRPLRLWILSREHGPADFARFAAKFPEVTAHWLPCDLVDYGPITGMLSHITVSTMDRLLLPDLLPELDRVVYHDIDALPMDDIAHLADLDLGGAPLAARSAVVRAVRSGFATIYSSAARWKDDPERADELLHRTLARHRYDFPAFNAGILVLDLDRMRRDDFGRQFLPYVERFGLNDQVVLNCYAGADRCHLPGRWNSFPSQEDVTDPAIIHWAGHAKPWKPGYVAWQGAWQAAQAESDARDVRAGLEQPRNNSPEDGTPAGTGTATEPGTDGAVVPEVVAGVDGAVVEPEVVAGTDQPDPDLAATDPATEPAATVPAAVEA